MKYTVRNSGDQVSVHGAAEPALVPLNWLAQELPDPKDQRKYAQERVVIAVTEAIAAAMERASLKRSDIADRLGKTRSHISQLLSGRRNLTLRTLGDILWACDLELDDLKVSTLGSIVCPVERVEEWQRDIAARSAMASISSFVADYNPISNAPPVEVTYRLQHVVQGGQVDSASPDASHVPNIELAMAA
jgi:transcriptional regulator with XRE-family HTH domain